MSYVCFIRLLKCSLFFAISSFQVSSAEEDVKEEIEFSTYPALLLGRMGVDREFQYRGVGSSILKHCLGLAQKINDDIACSALMLHTTRDVAEYYRKKGFKNIEPGISKRLITMYKLEYSQSIETAKYAVFINSIPFITPGLSYF